MSEERVVFIDFWNGRAAAETRRDELANLLAALSHHSERGVLDVLIEWTGSVQVDEEKFSEDIADFLFQYDQVQLKS